MRKIKELRVSQRAISIAGQVVLWMMFFLFPLHLYNVRIMDPYFFQRQIIDNVFFVLVFYLNVNFLLPRYFIRGRKLRYFIAILMAMILIVSQQFITERAFQLPMRVRFEPANVAYHDGRGPRGPEDNAVLNEATENRKAAIRADKLDARLPAIPTEKLEDSAFIKKYGLPPRPVILPQHRFFDHKGPGGPQGPDIGPLPWLNGNGGFVLFMVIRRAFGTTLLLLMVGSVWKLSLVWSRAEKEKEALQKEKLSAELKLLKSQINPHFLFNVLNSLYALSYKEHSGVSSSILKLSYIMRYMIYDTNAAEVGLQKEVEYLKNYIDLQRLRMPDFIEISFRAEGIQAAHCIEPMLLLPFIENAFKHGLSYLTPSKINIHLKVTADELSLEVDNPIVQQSEPAAVAQGGVGLANVKSRLKLLYGNHYQLKILQQDQRFQVHLQISLNKIKKDLYD